MSQTATIPSRFIGCDVGKQTVVVFDSTSKETISIPNRKPDLKRFAKKLDPRCFVVCEATGGFEAKLLEVMLICGRAIHRADARKVKAFIRSFGTLGKTDAIDAGMLARYGQERHKDLPLWTQPDPIRQELQSLALARIDLVGGRQAHKNRLAAPGAKAIAASLRAIIRAFDKEIRTITARIIQLVEKHPQMQLCRDAIQTIKGVGPVVANTLLALMPELGKISNSQAASLAGLAPHPKQSGAHNGYRNTRGGRPPVKQATFMAALVASRHDPFLSGVYQRLIKNGKKPIVATTAVMRKIVVICNAKARDALAQCVGSN
jgi:transposase